MLSFSNTGDSSVMLIDEFSFRSTGSLLIMSCITEVWIDS